MLEVTDEAWDELKNETATLTRSIQRLWEQFNEINDKYRETQKYMVQAWDSQAKLREQNIELLDYVMALDNKQTKGTYSSLNIEDSNTEQPIETEQPEKQ